MIILDPLTGRLVKIQTPGTPGSSGRQSSETTKLVHQAYRETHYPG
jgi:hypothetical protein